MPTTINYQPSTAVIAWLSLCAALIVAMVLLGGYTRLSGSGLSITEWKPIHGVIPPQSGQAWQDEFNAYKLTPQYSAINQGMTVEGFKTIFWPEFFHRLLGRAIGIIFILPLIVFTLTKNLSPRFSFRLLCIFALGGAQGFMGWYMVESGLITNPYVSHLRLAMHLSLALALLGLLIWTIMDISSFPRRRESISTLAQAEKWIPAYAGMTIWFTLLCLQILYGAFMAGLHAGLVYNSWPTMNGMLIPSDIGALSPPWVNLFENIATVQFIHRWLAVIVACGFIFWWIRAREYVRSKGLTRIAAALAGILAVQFVLGVLTLLKAVPLDLALTHQMLALMLFCSAVILLWKIRRG